MTAIDVMGSIIIVVNVGLFCVNAYLFVLRRRLGVSVVKPIAFMAFALCFICAEALLIRFQPG